MKMELTRLPDQDRVRVAAQADRLGPAGATRALEVLGDAFVGIQDAPDQRIPLEVALVRLTRPEADTSIAALLDRITRLEHGMGRPAVGVPPPRRPRRAGAAPPASRRPARRARAEPVGPPRRSRRRRCGHRPRTAAAAGRGGLAAGAREMLQAGKQARSGSRRPPRGQAGGVARHRPGVPVGRGPATTAGQPAAPAHRSCPGPLAPAPPDRPAPDGRSGDLPSRDELTLAWGDSILSALPARAKAFFGGGRFVEVTDGAAVFALPNAPHAERCEASRPDVEAALAAHFGRAGPAAVGRGRRPDASRPGRPGPVRRPAVVPRRQPEGDEDVDLTQLTDADDVATSSVDRVRELFPGAELVDEG